MNRKLSERSLDITHTSEYTQSEGIDFIKEVDFEVNEENFLAELCLFDLKRRREIQELKVLYFGQHKIQFKINEMQMLLNDMRHRDEKESEFDYMLSFDINKNFG